MCGSYVALCEQTQLSAQDCLAIATMLKTGCGRSGFPSCARRCQYGPWLGSALNLERARGMVGSLPLVENVATLIDPPGSDRDEPTWIADVLTASGAGLLLDLHASTSTPSILASTLRTRFAGCSSRASG